MLSSSSAGTDEHPPARPGDLRRPAQLADWTLKEAPVMKRWFKLFALSVAVPSLLIACAPAAAPAAKPPAQPSGPTAAASQPTSAVAKPAGAPAAPAEQLQPLSPPITISIGGPVPDPPYGTIAAIERG